MTPMTFSCEILPVTRIPDFDEQVVGQLLILLIDTLIWNRISGPPC